MSLSCQIHVSNPDDGIFKPGDSVSGSIKYQIYEPTQYTRITVSLKGKGSLDVDGVYKSRFFEQYVDIDEVIQEGDVNLAIGSYEVPFCFQLPTKIPSSFECNEMCSEYKVNRCCISYYIRIKFEKPRTLQSGKRFKKNITVGLSVKPKLSRQPVKFAKWRNLTQYGSNNPGSIHTAVLIQCSVLSPGEKIKLLYTIMNETNSMIEGVVVKLVEVLTFRPNRPLRKTKRYTDFNETINTSPPIYRREKYNGTADIVIPDHCKGTLKYSRLVLRSYWVYIVIKPPSPQSDLTFKIPVEIGEFNTVITTDSSTSTSTASSPTGDIGAPPSYWEVMGDDSNDAESDKNSSSDSNQ